jgi:drug/metabolite transporter (DMT)-like permease
MRPGAVLNSPTALMVIATLCWGGNVVVGKVAAMGYVPPFALSFFRWLVALAILLVLARGRLRHTVAALKGRWPLVVLLAMLSVGSYNTAQYWGLHYTTALNTAVVAATMPAFMFLATWIAGQERARPVQLAGLAAVTAGVVVVAARGSPARLLALQLNVGDLAILYSVLSWVVYSVLLRRLPKGLDPLGLITVFVAVGLPGILPFWLGEAVLVGLPPLGWQGIGLVAYAAIFPAIVAYLCWNRAVVLGGANLAAIMNNLAGVFAVLFAVTLLDERFRWFHGVGILLIIVGIYLAVVRRRAPV